MHPNICSVKVVGVVLGRGGGLLQPEFIILLYVLHSVNVEVVVLGGGGGGGGREDDTSPA